MTRIGKINRGLLGKLASGLAAVCLSVAFLGAGPVTTAKADGYVSFGFGTTFGHGHRHHRYGHYGYRHRHYGHRYYRHRHYGHRRYGHWHYGHHHHRHSHVTYTKVVPAAPARQARVAKPTASKPSQQSCLMIREYQTKITVGGQEVDAYGDACLQPDGSWRLGVPKQVPVS